MGGLRSADRMIGGGGDPVPGTASGNGTPGTSDYKPYTYDVMKKYLMRIDKYIDMFNADQMFTEAYLKDLKKNLKILKETEDKKNDNGGPFNKMFKLYYIKKNLVPTIDNDAITVPWGNSAEARAIKDKLKLKLPNGKVRVFEERRIHSMQFVEYGDLSKEQQQYDFDHLEDKKIPFEFMFNLLGKMSSTQQGGGATGATKGTKATEATKATKATEATKGTKGRKAITEASRGTKAITEASRGTKAITEASRGRKAITEASTTTATVTRS
ncbi:hypothetical protein CEUSTIGMA_g13620.t1 [Chlamydomonas eustigma]|uniref:Uncharacterized protein n=1 Tax=Chlamydomonas eustigma TaxID=1157962 RepID=A0A250XT41_9CHLO|nr:hypothetical protein CEUSTIGMA_g13620.t1 [Chlamydomonas eustigma]|eukprot:GAX86206.1 hypothetical protein CEUSTIGMA_g13620.t1 [Chlamydomonas eustigma]